MANIGHIGRKMKFEWKMDERLKKLGGWKMGWSNSRVLSPTLKYRDEIIDRSTIHWYGHHNIFQLGQPHTIHRNKKNTQIIRNLSFYGTTPTTHS
jgi:hypothetical protein